MGEKVMAVDRATVTQSHHILRSTYKLSLREKQLYLLAISKISPVFWEQEWDIEVTAEEWQRVYGGELRHAYQDMKTACDRLMEQPCLTFNTGPDHEQGVYKCHWVAGAYYIKSEAKIEIEFPKRLRKYLAGALLEEDGFSSYRLLGVGKLRSDYSIRFYEWMMGWKDTGILIIGVDELRDRLQLDGKYAKYKELKRWVIDKAMADISINSNYKASFKVNKKAGRKITSLLFTFKLKEGFEP